MTGGVGRRRRGIDPLNKRDNVPFLEWGGEPLVTLNWHPKLRGQEWLSKWLKQCEARSVASSTLRNVHVGKRQAAVSILSEKPINMLKLIERQNPAGRTH